MEVYAELKPNNIGMITVVTFDEKGKRIERVIYIEETEKGHIKLVIRDTSHGTPTKLDDSVFWQ